MESRIPNDFHEVFRGLSDECPPVFEPCIRKAFSPIYEIIVEAVVMKKSIEHGTVVMFVSGWYDIGRERIAKYVAKSAMESNLFDRLIWMIGSQNQTVPEEFQMQIAEILQIPLERNYDGEEDEEGFEVLARKIHACLEQQKFLLVHDASWGMNDLRRIGIPSIMSPGNYSLVLATSTDLKTDESELEPDKFRVSIKDKLVERDVWDLFWEESADVSATLSLRQVYISSENVMKCILYFAFIFHEKEAESMPRYWFAEEFIGDSNSEDLESTLGIGITLLEELQRRQILDWHKSPYFYKMGVYVKLKVVLCSSSPGFSRPIMVFNSTLVKKGNWRGEDSWICFQLTAQNFLLSSDSTNLTTISINDSPWEMFSNDFFEPMQNVRVLFSVRTSISSNLSFIVSFRKTLKLLQLSETPSLTNILQVSNLTTLENLEVLELSKTPLQNLPDNSLEGLHNLRLLDLSECEEITSLPSSLSLLLNLQHLLLVGCRSLSVLPSSLPLQKLELLDLSGTSLTQIPNNFFQHLLSLKNLNLSYSSQLKSLPASMSNLESCTSLIVVVPTLRHLSSSLQVLKLSNCSSLTDTDHLSSNFMNMSNLQVLDLNGTVSNVDSLILKGCSSLESINLPFRDNLVSLDLSGTKIKKFPLESCPTIKSLRSLVLLDVKNLCNVDWNIISWLPAQVNWDQCGDGSKTQMHIPVDQWFRVGNGYGVFISLCNPNIFQSLTPSSPLWIKDLSRFVIYIHPCMEKTLPRVSSYKDIYSKLKSCVPLHERCLEIEGVGSLQKGIRCVLRHTTFLYLHDHKLLKRLSSLGVENMDELKECWLERCHEMKVIFEVGHKEQENPILSCLEKMRISDLKKLSTMCLGVGNIHTGSFSQLKHLQLEYCPRLVMVFSSGFCLESLEVLEIKFCARLEEIFSGDLHNQGSLRRLNTLLLLELPCLNNIVRSVSLLSLKKAKIIGCPQLRRFPLQHTDDASSVEVTGERHWWEQLEWANSCKPPHISFNAWTPFDKKRAVG